MFKRASLIAALLSLVACAGSSSTTENGSEDEIIAAPPTVRTITSAEVSGVARHGDTIFYTDFQAVEVRSVPVSGGASKVLWKGRTRPMDQIGAMMLDDKDVFFVEDGQILRVPQTGGRFEILVRNSIDFPADIALDDTYVYWNSGSLTHSIVRRVAKAGGAPETLYDGPIGGTGLAVKDGFVFFSGLDRTKHGEEQTHWLMKVEAKPNGAVTQLARIDGGRGGLLVNGDDIVFANREGQPAAWGIRAMKASGGPVRTLATLGESDDVAPISLVAAGGDLFWSQSQTFDWHANPPGKHDAKIWKLAAGASSPRQLASGLDGAPNVAAEAGSCPVWGGRFDIATLDRCH